MSVAEILQELPRLSPVEQDIIRECLDGLMSEGFEETDEVLAAIDEGIRPAETEQGHTVEQVRAEIPSWLAKSS
jgi:hypothetical protein